MSKMRKKKFVRIKSTQILKASSAFFNYTLVCLRCLDTQTDNKYCATCGSKLIRLRKFKICDSCHRCQSSYSDYCEICGKKLEKAHYRSFYKVPFLQQIEKIEE